jgi:SpoVK/Ycf46/Vps4 family AAA+-type ATPase
MISAVISYDDDRVSIHTSKAKRVGDNFEEGMYLCIPTQTGYKIYIENFTEMHKPFKSKESAEVMSSVAAFFQDDIREKVNTIGFTHKLGVLLHGVAGTGKTSLMNYISDQMIKIKKAIVLLCSGNDSFNGAVSIAKQIREIQDNPIIFIADEFEKYASISEAEIKNFLDGNDSIDNSLFLASTNYLDKIPDTMINRPSRFRIISEIKGITDKDTMRSVLKDVSDKLQPNLFTNKEISDIVKDLESTTIDQLKHKALDKITNNHLGTSERPKVGFKAVQSSIKSDADPQLMHPIFGSLPYEEDIKPPNTSSDSNI